MGVAALVSLVTGTQIKAEQTIFLVTFGFEGIILLAAAFFSFQKFLQRSVDGSGSIAISIPGWQIAILVILACASILIGYQISEMETISWLFLPILTVPAIALPLGVLFAVWTQENFPWESAGKPGMSWVLE